MRILTNSLAIAAIAAMTSAPASADPSSCRARPDLAGACHSVRGELQLFDGTPAARIHVTGSRRVLGIASDVDAGNETFVAPQAVRDRAAFDTKLRGRFDVCPLEPPRANRMQTVCIDQASGLESVPSK